MVWERSGSFARRRPPKRERSDPWFGNGAGVSLAGGLRNGSGVTHGLERSGSFARRRPRQRERSDPWFGNGAGVSLAGGLRNGSGVTHGLGTEREFRSPEASETGAE